MQSDVKVKSRSLALSGIGLGNAWEALSVLLLVENHPHGQRHQEDMHDLGEGSFRLFQWLPELGKPESCPRKTPKSKTP